MNKYKLNKSDDGETVYSNGDGICHWCGHLVGTSELDCPYDCKNLPLIPMNVTTTIHTDGSASPNPGEGGWAAIITEDTEFAGTLCSPICGYVPHATNNQMELMATIRALEYLKDPTKLTIFTDSKYVKDGITSWINKWKINGWRTSAKKPVANKDLWQRLDEQCKRHTIKWEWCKGHAGNVNNEIVDELATKARMQLVADTIID